MYQSKKLKDKHTTGYYNIQKDETIRLIGRLRGGGKRGSSRASNRTAEEEKNKDEIIDELKHVIDITLKNIGTPKSVEFQQAMGHIKKLAIEVERNPDRLLEILKMLDRAGLMRFNAVNGINDKSTPQKIRVLKSSIFSEDLNAFKLMDDERANIENMFEKVVIYLVTAKYGMENGTITWSNMRMDCEKIVKAIDEKEGAEKLLAQQRLAAQQTKSAEDADMAAL